MPKIPTRTVTDLIKAGKVLPAFMELYDVLADGLLIGSGECEIKDYILTSTRFRERLLAALAEPEIPNDYWSLGHAAAANIESTVKNE